MKQKKWWILQYARPMGPKPVIYENNPPNQNIELVWIEEEERYMQDPWAEGHPESFSSEFEAIKYLRTCGYEIDEIKIVKEKISLKSI